MGVEKGSEVSEVDGAGVQRAGREESKKGEKQLRLTERDREVVAVIGQAGLLTTEQIASVLFAGRDESTVRQRLGALAGKEGAAPRTTYLQSFRTTTRMGAAQTVWALTKHGAWLAGEMLHRPVEPPRIPQAHALDDLLAVNDVFIAVLAGHRSSAFLRERFDWRSTESFRMSVPTETPNADSQFRLVIPDAIVDFPQSRVRLFLEVLTLPSSANAPPDSVAMTAALKLRRYRRLLRAASGGAPSGTYSSHFPDSFAPRVLMLIDGERCNAKLIEAALSTSGEPWEGIAVATSSDAIAELRSSLRDFLVTERGAEPRRSKEARELLRFYSEAISALKSARAEFRAQRMEAKLPKYPANTDSVRQLLLAMNGLSDGG